MSSHALRLWIAVLLAGTCLSLPPSPALAYADRTFEWANGSQGGSCWNGTHGWITSNATRMATRHGAGWVRSTQAVKRCVWPDTRFHDYKDHNSNLGGHPQTKVRRYYKLMVAALRRGNKSAASDHFGLLAHYYEDINNPMHTGGAMLESGHSAYEARVERLFGSMSSHRNWLHWDGNTHVTNASAFTVAASKRSHSQYRALVSNFARHGYNSKVGSITRTQLDRAVNGLVDLIYSAQYDADSVNAVIDSCSPRSATAPEPVTFKGHGVDRRFRIVAWEWTSNRDGLLSRKATFTTAGLSVGAHTISFRVKSATDRWSAKKYVAIVVSAESVSAVIDSASPRSVTTGQAVSFAGHGTDSHHSIIAWEWISSIDGLLSQTATFTTSDLSLGTHTIDFRVQCARGQWSPKQSVSIEVTTAGP
jgi:hypothetical protein